MNDLQVIKTRVSIIKHIETIFEEDEHLRSSMLNLEFQLRENQLQVQSDRRTYVNSCFLRS